jgi:hypothetical protein
MAKGLVAALVAAIPGLRTLARRSWCAKQRFRLRSDARRVVWVRDEEKMPWARWGAENAFFVLEWANQVPYLRAAAAGK